jgi:hypothetical protein
MTVNLEAHEPLAILRQRNLSPIELYQNTCTLYILERPIY